MSGLTVGDLLEERKKFCNYSSPDIPNIFKLLNLDPEDEEDMQKLDGDAIIREAQKNPHHLNSVYPYSFGYRYTPLYQAIVLGASYDVIRALCTNEAVKKKSGCYNGRVGTALSAACGYNASVEVVSFLLEKWPCAIRERDSEGYTPLHTACGNTASLEVVSFLLEKWPEAIREKDRYESTPLHEACRYDTPIEVISFLLEKWPQAIRERNAMGETPLNSACLGISPVEKITLLLEKWPQAVKEEDNNGRTPYDNCSGQRVLLSHVSKLCGDETDDGASAEEMMRFFMDIDWKFGIALVLDKHPLVAKDLGIGTNDLPHFLCWVGHHCKLKTMWCVIKNKQDILESI